MTNTTDGLLWFNTTNLNVEGRGWTDTKSFMIACRGLKPPFASRLGFEPSFFRHVCALRHRCDHDPHALVLRMHGSTNRT